MQVIRETKPDNASSLHAQIQRLLNSAKRHAHFMHKPSSSNAKIPKNANLFTYFAAFPLTLRPFIPSNFFTKARCTS